MSASTHIGDNTAFIKAMPAVARAILGEPNKRLSSEDELRFGTHGSVSVDLASGKYCDFENGGVGGGVLHLLKAKKGLDKDDALQWLRDNRHLPEAKEPWNVVATYDYCDADGTLLYQALRLDPKEFRLRRPDGKGGWVYTEVLKGRKRVPYRLPEIVSAKAGVPIFVVEGEKDANRLAKLGFVATCNAGGAANLGQKKKWPDEFRDYFNQRDVVVIPDNDEPGENHAIAVARNLSGMLSPAASVRIVRLPDLPPKGDVSDWIVSGGTADRLWEIIEATPLFQPGRPEPDAEPVAEPMADPVGALGEKPTIRVVAGDLHHNASAGEGAIIASDRSVYQRGPNLVRPIQREVPASRGRTTIAAGLGDLTAPALVDIFSSVARWIKYDGQKKAWVTINPPISVANILLSRQGLWSLPSIAGVVTCPTLRPDGSLLSEPGYDAATRLYLMQDPGLKLTPAVYNPTRSDALQALADLNGLLDEFPFAEERDGEIPLKDKLSRAVALSGVITPVVRGALSVAPLHAFRAHAPGSGKSFLVDVVTAVSLGRPCPVISAGSDEAEMEKRLGGLLLAGYPVVSIDNCNEQLGGDLLAQAVERPIVQIRRLGGSDIIEIESKSCLFSTGNNLQLRGDMVRRGLVADLDPRVERPELREFTANPVEAIAADRGRYVSACLIIARAYILAGCPELKKPLASFEDWSGVVRSALCWLGCADPVVSMEAARADDPELSELSEMLTIWESVFGLNGKATVREAVARSEEMTFKTHDEHGRELTTPIPTSEPRWPELRDALHRIAGERGNVNTKRLGNWFSAKDKRQVGDKRFNRGDKLSSSGSVLWFVEAVKSRA